MILQSSPSLARLFGGSGAKGASEAVEGTGGVGIAAAADRSGAVDGSKEGNGHAEWLAGRSGSAAVAIEGAVLSEQFGVADVAVGGWISVTVCFGEAAVFLPGSKADEAAGFWPFEVGRAKRLVVEVVGADGRMLRLKVGDRVMGRVE